MREIKFRAFNPINNEFEYWSFNDLCYHCTDRPDLCLEDWQQFTGRKDQDGNDVYESLDNDKSQIRYGGVSAWKKFGKMMGYWDYFEKEVKTDFLKKILPEKKSNLFLTRGFHPEEFIGKELAYPYNYCLYEIKDRASKEGIKLK